MKWFLFLWAMPVAFLGGWYGLSYYDMNFGFFMLTRETHDLVFRIYGNILGIPPHDLPPLVARAIVVDSFLVLGLIAFRRRRKIAAWWRERRQASSSVAASSDSLSSAP